MVPEVWSNTTALDVAVKIFNGCNYYNELTLNKGDYF